MAETAAANGQADNLITVRRTMLVLEMLADADAGLSLSDIAKTLDVNKSIALRITATLEEMNYIYRGDENRRFYASYKISNIALRILSRAGLLDQCQPVLRRLAEQTGELVLLSVIDHDQPRWVMAILGVRRRLQVEPRTYMEPHYTATGKAWLATLPDEEVRRLLKGHMHRRTANTITTMERMRKELQEIRASGVSFSNEENETGIAAVATGIWLRQDGPPVCVGFISVTAPLARVTFDEFAGYRTFLVDAARALADAWPAPKTAEFSDGVRRLDGLVVVTQDERDRTEV